MDHVATAAGDTELETATGKALAPKALGWAIFEFARNPYYNVIVIALFAPYFAREVVGDPVRGQALVANSILVAGLSMAVVCPILGALVDKGGYLKPPILVTVLSLAATTAALWFVEPGVPGAVVIGMALMATGYCLYTVLEFFHNAMLPLSARPSSLPVVSGIGLALGNFAGIAALFLMFALFASDTRPPPFGLDPERFENLRIAGPLVALWFVAFVTPFFLLMPDIKITPGRNWRDAVRGLLATRGNPVTYVQDLFRLNGNVMRFLVGRMIYADGIAALLVLGSVYVGGFLGWSAGQLLVYNILGGLCAVIGALLGGLMDQRFGPKNSLRIELSVIIAILLFQLSVTPDALLFGLIPAGHEVWPGGLFPTLSDVVYLAAILPAGMMLGACISSSRYMLVHIAPPKQIGQFFGFYSMAGSITVWIGPGLVGLMTTLSGDQLIGMSGLGLLFVAGLWIISGVRSDRTPEYLKQSVAGAT